MRRAFLIILAITIANSVFSQEEGRGPVALDAGGFISYGHIEYNSGSEFDQAVGFFASLLSIRGGVSATLRYRMSDLLSAGIEAGYATMQISNDTTNVNLNDFPVNAVFRLGGGQSFIEGHGGYYISDSIYGGVSAGAKFSAGGVYFDYTHIFGEFFTYPRFSLGYQYNNIF